MQAVYSTVEPRDRLDAIIGKNHKMKEINGLVVQVADSTASVLITERIEPGKSW